MKCRSSVIALVGLTPLLFAANALAAEGKPPDVARAQVWQATNIPFMNIKAGPTGPGAFPFRAEVDCNYLDKELSGRSPKFACMKAGNDELKVKFGGTNGEVYGEVAASRLLWALGFGADHMYSVKVICHGCPAEFNGIIRDNGDRVFDPATIERKMPGALISDQWSWKQIDEIDEEAGGAPLAHRDALKLMAVFLQHSDTKPAQQRLICLGGDGDLPAGAACDKPFILIQDVGVTFGRATMFNANTTSSMNLVGWSSTPVWKSATGPCVGNLSKSFTGTLGEPVISEAGRAFLAGLLQQLTEAQIRDLFKISRVALRLREPGNAKSGFSTVDEWVTVFKQKRAEIVNRRCA
jgi:hypothetical protein